MIRALFGGSFDPFHEGHLGIVRLLLDRDLADVVHVTPAGRSPFKDDAFAAAADRLAMCRAALVGVDGAVVEDLETRRDGPSYTIDTLDALQARHPDDRWRLVVGADSLAGFADWHEPDRLLEAAELVVFSRPGETDPATPPGARLLRVDDYAAPVASREVRGVLERGTIPTADLPAAVADIIRDRRLYGCGGDRREDPCP